MQSFAPMTKPIHAGPPAPTREQVAQLRAKALPMSREHGGMVSDAEHLQVLVYTRRKLDIHDTVVAIPFSLIVAAALNIVGQFGVPSLAQSEQLLAKQNAERGVTS